MRRIESGRTNEGDPTYVTVNNQQQWQDAWRHYFDGQPPPVDFNVEFAVIAFYNTQRDSCHEFSIKSASLKGQELTISTDFRDLHGMQYACLTWLEQPYDVVAISKLGIKQGRYNVAIVELGGPKAFGLGRQVLYEREMNLP